MEIYPIGYVATVESDRLCKPELSVCFPKINFVLFIQNFTGFSYTEFYGVRDYRKKIKTRFFLCNIGLQNS